MSAPLPPRGRGTASNPLNRFAPTHSEAFDDGWEQDVPPIQLTEVREEIARTVISRNQSPDLLSIVRSIPTVVASMAASTAMRGPAMPIGTSRRGSISRPG